jgi:AcrR family transcriptional regulator
MERAGRRRPARQGPRRARLRPEQRREQLLDVAGEMLLSSGFESLTMEGVAQRAGVSKGLGYAYFENAEALALALHQREVAAVYHRVEEAMGGRATFAERLPRALGAYLDVVAERGALFAILERGLSGRRRRKSAKRPLGSFLAFWTEQLRNDLGVEAPVAAALAGVVLSTCDLFARIWKSGRLPRVDAERLCVDFVLAGLAATKVQPRARRVVRGSRA